MHGGELPFEAKISAPSGHGQPGHGQPGTHPELEKAAQGTITVFEDPDGCLPTEFLASTLRGMGKRPVWLRPGPEDSDPGTFLVSLAAAARRCDPAAGQVTLGQMRAHPGPVHGWPPLFAQLARELRECLGERHVMVLEDSEDTLSHGDILPLAGTHFLAELAHVTPVVVVARHRSLAGTPNACVRQAIPELHTPDEAVGWILRQCAPALRGRARDHALTVIDGRTAVLVALCDVRALAGEGRAEAALKHAASWEDVLARVASTLLREADEESRRALGLMVLTHYAHPGMSSAAVGLGRLLPGPWLQSLDDGWVRLRTCWRRPLRTALGKNAMPGRDMLLRTADWLLGAGETEQAIFLYLELKDSERAARAIAHRANGFMDLGQWVTLEGWLSRLPDSTFASFPELIHVRAEIAAACGEFGAAKRWFGAAAAQFAKRDDAKSACRSMLAGSVAAAGSGDIATAFSRANAAASLADAAGLPSVQMWAAWQQGRIALATGDTRAALAAFSRAAAIPPAGEQPRAEPVRRSGELSMRIEELRRLRQSHREADAALGQAEHQTLSELLASVKTPGSHDGALLGLTWSQSPAPLKLPGLRVPGTLIPDGSRGLRALLHRPALRIRHSGDRRGSDDGGLADRAGAGPGSGPGVMDWVSGPTAGDGGSAVRPARADGPGALAGRLLRRRQGPPADLAVHLLGPLVVTVNDVAVEGWHSGRQRSLFGYLVTHRQPWPTREVLMEAFWPESSPAASRNSLNVALHGLRRTLRSATNAPVIVYSGGIYRIDPRLRLWLDLEEFDLRVAHGHRMEKAGDSGHAAEDYEFAAELYRGEFLEDDPYEEWAALPRERLRLAYLDTLGRLSSLYFRADRYAAAANLCQRIIERDPCREDAHRRLMRCYSRQGQPHLALMQYQACARALTKELGVEPEPATTKLRDQIRQHEPV